MSILNVNQLQPVGGGNTITVGSSNIDYSGSVTGNISIDGNLTVAGVLTYDDVTNVDSIGIITARNGLHVTSGNVAIGHNNPLNTLHVKGPTGGVSARFTDAVNATVFVSHPSSGKSKIADAGGNYGFEFDTASVNVLSGGSERLRIRSDGRIAIGTQTINTDSMLSIHRSSSDQSQIRFTNTTTGEGGNNGFIVGIDNNEHGRIFNVENQPLRFGTNNTERLRITSGGYLGINEINPTQQLSVHNDTNYEGILINGNSAPRITFARSNSTTVEWGVGIDGTNGNNFAIAQAGNTAKLVIDASGKIGIGDATPENALTIKNIGSFEGDANSFYLGSNFTGTGQNFSGSGKHAQRFFFNNASGNGYLRYENTGTTGNAGDAITWQERFRIRSDGKISTGTNLNTTNTYEFSVTGADSTGGFYAHGRNHYLSNRSNAYSSLTLKKANADSDGIDYLQLRDSSNALKGQITGAGNWKPISGGGIDFSAFGNAGGMTSELLDDYEEGSSTVSIQNITADTNEVVMKYTKIGSVVCVVGVITIVNKTVSSGANGWFALPFAPSHHSTSVPGCSIQKNSINTNVAYLGFYGNNTNCYFMSRSGGYQNGNSLSNGQIGFTATYTTH